MTVEVDLPQAIDVAVGERRQLRLPTYAGSGNYWSAVCVNGEAVAKVSIEADSIPDSPHTSETQPPPIQMAEEWLVVEGLAAGQSSWRLVLGRSFTPATPLATHDLQIVVQALSTE